MSFFPGEIAVRGGPVRKCEQMLAAREGERFTAEGTRGRGEDEKQERSLLRSFSVPSRALRGEIC
ncbi:hypothetical protein VT84_23330 [Gemmata sp. SH-PL17]|nr:hypothetical protein VT84_23330 [Gemmata sp. SH-PL17]